MSNRKFSARKQSLDAALATEYDDYRAVLDMIERVAWSLEQLKAKSS